MTELEKTEVQQQDEVQRTPDEAYCVAEMRFLCASRILIRSTGEVVKITPVMKLAYLYMRNQYISFSRRRQQFYTDQRQMAKALDISRDTFSKVLAELKKLGIVETAGWKGNSESYAVHFFSDVADGLEVIHQEWKGAPAWDHDRANKNFKSKKQMVKTDERGKEEQKSDVVEPASPAAGEPDDVPDIHSDQHDDISANDAVNGAEHSRQCETPPVLAVNGAESEQWETPQRADIFDLKLWREEGPSGFGFMEYGKEHGETEVEKIAALIDQHYTDAIKIFDENYVVTEEFINSLSGDAAPNRNTDGTLQSFRYVYWVARYSQDERDGIPVRTRQEYMAEAKPEYIPAHLMPKSEPVQDFSNETIPY
ncbi:helix-turn-helix domain-containing protein [Klebsiella aerogenes]|uniref:helix-turn-helix domain-containing protein n=1 Tax=Klebsiella aerogenes TaxID=548 RepID=UPI001495143F|nr:helix-turn-helix domain-containing protein [Klebsiella aerogenes]NPD59526.1 winged helix-turn-helix domain-containing protein [Klebsiella aerogenes]